MSTLGSPSDIDFDNSGQKKWTYVYSKKADKFVNYIPYVNLFHNGNHDTDKKVVILFDENDVVKDYLISQTHGQTNRGLIH